MKSNCEEQPNFMTGIILDYNDREQLEQWLKHVYTTHCVKQKSKPYNVINYDYNTGEIIVGGGYRKKSTAMKPFYMARGFIATFYKGEITTIERRTFI